MTDGDAWLSAVRSGLSTSLAALPQLSAATDLQTVGFYREKLSYYTSGKRFPRGPALVLAMIRLGMTIEVRAPDGTRWIVRAERWPEQLSFLASPDLAK